MTTLVCVASLGTTVASCWGPVLAQVPDGLDVVAWDLPGHGRQPRGDRRPLTVPDLARGVLSAVDEPFLFAGVSLGGQVGLQLLLDAPERVLGAVLCCTGATISDRAAWAARSAQVEASGTASLVGTAAGRWFAPGFATRRPEITGELLRDLGAADDVAYSELCSAIAAFDVRDRLADITSPLVAVAGSRDAVCPPASLRQIAEGVQRGSWVLLDDVGHLAPAESPHAVARIIADLARATPEQDP